MMHRSKKPLRNGVREYFNQKRPVNMRVDGIDGTAHLVEALPTARGYSDKDRWALLIRATCGWMIAMARTSASCFGKRSTRIGYQIM
jgi:hypothetical protein